MLLTSTRERLISSLGRKAPSSPRSPGIPIAAQPGSCPWVVVLLRLALGQLARDLYPDTVHELGVAPHSRQSTRSCTLHRSLMELNLDDLPLLRLRTSAMLPMSRPCVTRSDSPQDVWQAATDPFLCHLPFPGGRAAREPRGEVEDSGRAHGVSGCGRRSGRLSQALHRSDHPCRSLAFHSCNCPVEENGDAAGSDCGHDHYLSKNHDRGRLCPYLGLFLCLSRDRGRQGKASGCGSCLHRACIGPLDL